MESGGAKPSGAGRKSSSSRRQQPGGGTAALWVTTHIGAKARDHKQVADVLLADLVGKGGALFGQLVLKIGHGLVRTAAELHQLETLEGLPLCHSLGTATASAAACAATTAAPAGAVALRFREHKGQLELLWLPAELILDSRDRLRALRGGQRKLLTAASAQWRSSAAIHLKRTARQPIQSGAALTSRLESS